MHTASLDREGSVKGGPYTVEPIPGGGQYGLMRVTDGGVQVLGGHGYIREFPVELWLRNGRGFTTFDGLAMA